MSFTRKEKHGKSMSEMKTPGSGFSLSYLKSIKVQFPVLSRRNPESYVQFGDKQS